MNIINSNKKGRYLIFSDYNETFNNIWISLYDNNIKCKEIKGHVSSITKTIKDFEKSKIQVIMLNSMYNAAGLNLHMATDVILYHKMSVSTQKQVIGRAQRPGRTEPLTVHYLCYDHEKIE